jgi:hypothetical protein
MIFKIRRVVTATIVLFFLSVPFGLSQSIDAPELLVFHYFDRWIDDNLVDGFPNSIRYFDSMKNDLSKEEHGQLAVNFYMGLPKILSFHHSNENIDLGSGIVETDITIAKVQLSVIGYGRKYPKESQIEFYNSPHKVYDYVLLANDPTKKQLAILTHFPNLWGPERGDIVFFGAEREVKMNAFGFKDSIEEYLKKARK